MSSFSLFSHHNYLFLSVILTGFTLPILILLLSLCNNCKRRRNQCSINGDDPSNVVSTGLVLNSMANGDGPHHGEYNIDDNNSTRLKGISVNRALPDIPINVNQTDSINTSGKQIENERPTSNSSMTAKPILRRSNKPRAPLPPTLAQIPSPLPPASLIKEDSVDKSDDEAIDTSLHHPYARIKNNQVIDSSTENDTDDYCDPRTCTNPSGPSSSENRAQMDENYTEPTYSPVDQERLDESVNLSPYLSERLSTTAGFAVSGRVLSNEIPYMTPPPSVRPNDDIHQRSLHSSMEEITGQSSNEISYNKISVREPLSKVLAERAILEHHYTEVDEEGNSCFYEEIAGSTNSSVTYTKIGDISNGESTNPQQSNAYSEGHYSMSSPSTSSRPPPPSVESLLVVAESSRSTSPQPLHSDHHPLPLGTTVSNSVGRNSGPSLSDPRLSELYALVDKGKKNNNSSNNSVTTNNLEELYAKVHKPSNRDANKRLSSGPCIDSEVSHHHSHHHHHHHNPLGTSSSSPMHLPQSPIPPASSPSSNSKDHSVHRLSNSETPPPPPPLLNIPSRSSRTISMYDETSKLGAINKTTANATVMATATPAMPPHQRRHSSGNVNFISYNANQYNQITTKGSSRTTSARDDEAIEDPGYEIVGPCNTETIEVEADPGYEPIRIITTSDGAPSASQTPHFHHHHHSHVTHHHPPPSSQPPHPPPHPHSHTHSSRHSGPLHHHLHHHQQLRQFREEEDAIADPGYEVVNFHFSNQNESEPCYEVISKNYNNSGNDETVDPGYEIVKQKPSTSSRQSIDATTNGCQIANRLNRNESDVSQEPGYERVRYQSRKVSESSSDPAYASIREPGDNEDSNKIDHL